MTLRVEQTEAHLEGIETWRQPSLASRWSGPRGYVDQQIDLIAVSESGDTMYLVMSEMGPWDGSTGRLAHIQTRLNHYLSFALDGELRRRFPEAARMTLCIRIDLDHEPDPGSAAFLERARQVCEREAVPLLVEVLPRPADA